MGANNVGQLGIGEKGVKYKNTPTLVEHLAEYFVSQVSCGNEHTLALTENGQVYSWGYGKQGALGNGRSDSQYEPILLSFAEAIIEIGAGAHHSAFINKNNVLSVCGNGAKGQLGLP
jgi:alpha-tubulin suppressor-like RCC1 family protein